MYGIKTTAFLSLITARLGRGVGQLVLAVLLLNFLSTAALSANSLRQEGDLLSGGQTVIICTPQGLKRISLDENGNPTQDNKGSLEHCIYCLPFHKVVASAAFPEIDFPVVGPVSYKRDFARYVPHIPDAPLNAACPPRAPPLA